MILQRNLRDGNKVQKHHMVLVRYLIFKWHFFTETGKVESGKNPKFGFFFLALMHTIGQRVF
jgi:hypothetical protein